MKIQSDLISDGKRQTEMICPFLDFENSNNVSEMPCRLIDDLHEWRNEIATVPSLSPLNTLFRCKSRRFPVGSEDPVKLYCSL